MKYNALIKRVRVTTVTVKKQEVVLWMHIFSLSYPARNAHAPYCHQWPLRLYSVFPYDLKNGAIFENNKHWTQYVCCDFLYKFVWNISNSKTYSVGYYHKRTQVWF